MLVDTHCHLDFEVFDDDREEVLLRAEEVGVSRILTPGIDIVSSKKAVQLAESHDIVFAAVGVHPNNAHTWDDETVAELRNLAASPKVVALGEIGLDYYRDVAAHDLQTKIFNCQVNLASELGLPVVIHNRHATEDLFEILKNWHKILADMESPLVERPGVLHSYSGSFETATEAIGMNFLVGFTGPVTFHNAVDIQRVASAIRVDHILSETDAPFLAPHPFRGKRNEPAHVRLVVEKIAELHGESYPFVARKITANASRLFEW